MKVLHVIPSLSPSRGGPTEAMRTMATGLVESGVTVDIATTDDDGPAARIISAPAFAKEAGAGVYRFPRAASFYTFSPKLSSWLRQHVADYDLLHLHSLFSYPSTAAAFIARHRVPYIVRPLGTLAHWGMTQRRPWMKRLSFPLIEKRILERASLVHFTSTEEQSVAQDCGAQFRSVVIPNAVMLPMRNAPAAGHRPPHVLFLGRFDPVKGIDLLLPAFVSVAAKIPAAKLILAGDGAPGYVESLRNKARQLGIEDRITWPGFLEGKAKQEAFAGAAVFVMPSRSESFGIAAVEAMAHGLPVVVTNAVPIHGAITEAGAGLAVPCDFDAIAYALTSLLSNEQARARMGERGRDYALRNYSSRVIGQSLALVYRDIQNARAGEARHVRPAQA